MENIGCMAQKGLAKNCAGKTMDERHDEAMAREAQKGPRPAAEILAALTGKEKVSTQGASM